MGIVVGGALSNLVRADKYLTFPVPQNWSLEDAATVPVVYLTVVYALNVIITKIVHQFLPIPFSASISKLRQKYFNTRRKWWDRPSRNQPLPLLRS